MRQSAALRQPITTIAGDQREDHEMMSVEEILQMQKRITGKLTAAIAMLLVSSILLGMTSYAWFILSAAPEVKEMQVTAGANGALEIALLNANGDVDESTVGNSNVVVKNALSNTTWGNLVDLSEGYGLENLTLYPSRLALVSQGDQKSYTVDRQHILNYPEFGRDGRITGLLSASKAYYKDNSFAGDPSHFGVNVLGRVSDSGGEKETVTLTYSRDRILKEATAKVKDYQQSLRERMVAIINDNAAGLFNLLLTASSLDPDADESQGGVINTKESYETTNNIVTRLQALTGDAEDSLRWALLGYVASDTEHYNEEIDGSMAELGKIYKTFRSLTLVDDGTSEGKTVYSIARENGYTELVDAVSALRDMESSVKGAREYLNRGQDNALLACVKLLNIKESWIMNAGETNGGNGTLLYASDGGFRYDLKNKIYRDEIFFLGKTTDGAVFDNMAKIVGDFSAEVTAYVDEESGTKFVDSSASPNSPPYKLTAHFTSKTTREEYSEFIKKKDNGHEYTAFSYSFEKYYKDESGNWYAAGGLEKLSDAETEIMNNSLYTDGTVINGRTEYTYKKELLSGTVLFLQAYQDTTDGLFYSKAGTGTVEISLDYLLKDKVVNTGEVYSEESDSYLICKYGSDTLYIKTDPSQNFKWNGAAEWYKNTGNKLLPISDPALIQELNARAEPGHIGVLGLVYQAADGLNATGNVPFTYERTDITAFGYTVDLAFRSSGRGNLLLQKDPADRVQQGQVNSSTQGGGSYMSFTVAGDMTEEEARQLIQSIHVAFMNTQTGEIYKIAAAADVSMELNKATARFDLYEPKYEVTADGQVYVTCGARDDSGTITGLPDNNLDELRITAVVYVNGDTVRGDGLSATQGLSLDGMVNLQFASDSDLSPMEYDDYIIGYKSYSYEGRTYYLGTDGKWYDADKKRIEDEDLIKKLEDNLT